MGFPFKLEPTTRISITEKAWKDGPLKVTLRTASKTIVYKRNDRWFNKNNRLMLMMWLGNCDYAVLIDSEQVTSYVCKYGAKGEKASKGYDVIFAEVMSKAQRFDCPASSALRSLLMRTCGGADKTQQETAHRMLSLPYVVNSKHVITINLRNEYRAVQKQALVAVEEANEDAEEGADNDEATVKMSLMDAYAARFEDSVWQRKQTKNAFLSVYGDGDVNLLFFCQTYRLQGRGNKAKLVPHDVNKWPVVVFSPDFYVLPGSRDYADACFLSLLKWKPWQGFVESVYGGERNTHDLTSEACRNAIINSFNEFSALVLNAAPGSPIILNGTQCLPYSLPSSPTLSIYRCACPSSLAASSSQDGAAPRTHVGAKRKRV